jgi:hypothetical protein
MRLVKVTHLSGAGAYIDKLDQEIDDLGVLACDGGSSDVPNYVFWRSMMRTGDRPIK